MYVVDIAVTVIIRIVVGVRDRIAGWVVGVRPEPARQFVQVLLEARIKHSHDYWLGRSGIHNVPGALDVDVETLVPTRGALKNPRVFQPPLVAVCRFVLGFRSVLRCGSQHRVIGGDALDSSVSLQEIDGLL